MMTMTMTMLIDDDDDDDDDDDSDASSFHWTQNLEFLCEIGSFYLRMRSKDS